MILPNFLCIGAPKAGTTSLYHACKLHPEIGTSSFKEPRFFNEHYEKGLKWYSEAYFHSRKNTAATGEFTPVYLGDPLCPERMLESIGPSIKLIVVIRNPVERAYSHFLHRQSEGIETRSFLEALEDEEREIEALEKNCTPRTGYLWHSYYGQHLNHYLKTFSKENFLICSFEKDLIKEFHATMSLLWDFLGVSKIEIPEAIHVNAYRLPPRSIMWLKRLINGDASPNSLLKNPARNVLEC